MLPLVDAFSDPPRLNAFNGEPRMAQSIVPGISPSRTDRRALAACLALSIVSSIVLAQPVVPPHDHPPPPPPNTPAAELKGLDALRRDAAMLKAVAARTALASEFLDATRTLPDFGTRIIYRNRATNEALSEQEFGDRPENEREGFEKREYDSTFYYSTGYGSPLVYGRVLDVIGTLTGWESLAGKHIADFGYGTIGHLRLMAANGARVTGVDVDPVLRALYSQPEDQGKVMPRDVLPSSAPTTQFGFLNLRFGRFPAEIALARSWPQLNAVSIDQEIDEYVRWGILEPGLRGFDIITSKNTLKLGYIHPKRPVDERRLVKLGVDDEQFLTAIRNSLKPGGYFIVYNISPPQSPPDKDYLPHADGEFPFDIALARRLGFEVLYFNADDKDYLAPWWTTLGYAKADGSEATSPTYFVSLTVLRKGHHAPQGTVFDPLNKNVPERGQDPAKPVAPGNQDR
jgi:SAM-dependent methyltransferase